jgi:hypothetical protein
VRLNVLLGRVFGVLRGMKAVAVREVGMVCGLFVVASRMVSGGLVVVARSVLVVFRCLLVMLDCF